MIKRIILVIFVLFVSACSPSARTMPSLSTQPQIAASSTTIIQIETATPTMKIGTAAPTIPATKTQEPVSFDLSEPGPFFAGNRAYTFVDPSRNNREIIVILWYPALEQKDSLGSLL